MKEMNFTKIKRDSSTGRGKGRKAVARKARGGRKVGVAENGHADKLTPRPI